MEVEKVNTYKAQLDFFCSEEVDRYCLEITTNLSKQELVSKMKKWNQRLNENEVYEEEGFNCDTILSYVKTHDPKLQWTVLVFLTIVEKPVTFSFYGCDIEVTFAVSYTHLTLPTTSRV